MAERVKDSYLAELSNTAINQKNIRLKSSPEKCEKASRNTDIHWVVPSDYVSITEEKMEMERGGGSRVGLCFVKVMEGQWWNKYSNLFGKSIYSYI